MAHWMAGKRWLVLILMIVSTALVAARSARRRGSRPRDFPPTVPRSPRVPAAGADAEVPAPAGRPTASAGALSALESAPVASPAQPTVVADPPQRADPARSAVQSDPSASAVSSAEPTREPRPGPFPGSALAGPDGSAPSAEYVIKGNPNSKRCHGPSSPYYGRTRAEVWFRSEEDAVAAGFRPWAPKGR